MNGSANITCPTCASSVTQTLRNISSEHASQHFVLKNIEKDRHVLVRDAIERLWQAKSCAIMECAECGFTFAYPFIGGDKDFYDHAFERSSYPKDKWEYDYAISTISRSNGSMENCNVLEIGAGNGAFLKKLQNAFSGFEYEALEYSDFGRNSIEAMGYKCRPIDLLCLHDAEVFDYIFMFQVLEHMDQLSIRMNKLADMLAPGGHLVIAVPAHKRITFNEGHGALLDMPPNHIGRFTEQSFSSLGKRAGLELVDFAEEQHKLLSGMKCYLVYRHLRSSQNEGSFANMAESTKNQTIKKMMRIVSVLHQTILGLPIYMLGSPRVGESAVAVLRKMGNPAKR